MRKTLAKTFFIPCVALPPPIVLPLYIAVALSIALPLFVTRLHRSQSYRYEDVLHTQYNGVDFVDILSLVLKLLQTHPAILQDLKQRYQYYVVDEFQVR